MVDAEPPFEQRLRAEGAEQRELHGGGHDPPDTEAAGEGSVNLTKQALKRSFLVQRKRMLHREAGQLQATRYILMLVEALVTAGVTELSVTSSRLLAGLQEGSVVLLAGVVVASPVLPCVH